jgi:hypothetical protein
MFLLTSLFLSCKMGPVFELRNFVVEPSEVVSGNSVDVSLEVWNTGDTPGTYVVTLEVDDVEEKTLEVNVDAQSVENISFSVTEKGLGIHSVNINGLMSTFNVIDEWQLSVLSVQKKESIPLGPASVTDMALYPGERKVFLLVETEFVYMGSEPCKWSSNQLSVSDSNDRFYPAVGIVLDYAIGNLSTQAEPGFKSTPVIGFIVPVDAHGFLMYFQNRPPIDLGI